jgi:hypothetical protein
MPSNVTFTIDTGLSFVAGEFVQVIHDSNNYFFGQIVSYNFSTGVLVLSPTSPGVGSGTYTSWNVIASGYHGTSAIGGTNGTSALSATSGTSGTSATAGSSGTDGSSATSGPQVLQQHQAQLVLMDYLLLVE